MRTKMQPWSSGGAYVNYLDGLLTKPESTRWIVEVDDRAVGVTFLHQVDVTDRREALRAAGQDVQLARNALLPTIAVDVVPMVTLEATAVPPPVLPAAHWAVVTPSNTV